jgi:hypothetical protein
MQATEKSWVRGRLARQAMAGKRSTGSQVLAKAAQVLISVGESLKAISGKETALNP